MLYKVIIFLTAMYCLNGAAPSSGSTKRITPSLYTVGGTTITALEDKLAARAKVEGTTHAANDTLISQLMVEQPTTFQYSFRTYVTAPRCDSLKVYIDGVKVYTYNYTTTGFVQHSFTAKVTPLTPATIKFVTIYGDTLAGSWYLENKYILQ